MKSLNLVGWLAIFMAGCGTATDPGQPAPSVSGSAAPFANSSAAPSPAPATSEPSIALQVASWARVQDLVKEHLGKIVVIDIWSTTCPPCRRDFPELVKLHRDFGDRGVVCVSFNCDYDGIPEKPPEYYRERVVKFLTEQQATLFNLQSNEPLDQLLDSGKISGMPAVLVYNREGELAKDFHNANVTAVEDEFRYDDIRRLVEGLLATSTTK